MKKLKLPMVVRVNVMGTSETEYTITKGSEEGKVTYTYRNIAGEESVYENHATEDFVQLLIEEGKYHVVRTEERDPMSFKINIDSSAVTAALAEVKELEATLLRVKGMLK